MIHLADKLSRLQRVLAFFLALPVLCLIFASPLLAETSPGSNDQFSKAPYLLIDEELMVIHTSEGGSKAYCFLPSSDDFSDGKWDPDSLSQNWHKDTGLGGNLDDVIMLRDDENTPFLAQVWENEDTTDNIQVSLVSADQSGFGTPYATFKAGTGSSPVATAADFVDNGGQELIVGFIDGSKQINFSISLPSADPDPVFFTDTETTLKSDSALRIAAGDVDGDGRPEVAALYISSENKLTVNLYSVDRERNVEYMGSHSLPHTINFFDIAFADWEGNGKEMILCCHMDDQSNLKWYIKLISVDLSGSTPSFTEELSESAIYSGNIVPAGDIKVVAGDMDGDGKDELALAFPLLKIEFPISPNRTEVHVFFHTSDGFSRTNPRNINGVVSDMKMGSFTGKLYPSSTARNHTQLAITGDSNLHIFSLNRDGDTASLTSSSASPGGSGNHLVTGDLDGDSMILGDPTHIVLENHISPILFLNEPPKHTDADLSGKVTNYSRYDDFVLQYAQSETESSETTNAQTMESDMGVSLTEDVKAGVDLGVASFSVEEKISVNKSVSGKKESIESNFSSRSTSLTGQTNRDDYVLFRCHTINIWRYPILGWLRESENGEEKGQAFYQVVIPDSGALDEAIHFIAGRNVDWYHPATMNGNVLSYPSYTDQIPDYSDDQLLSELVTLDVGGGNTASRSINWSNTETLEKMKDMSVSMGIDSETQFSGSVKGVAVEAEATTTIDVNIDERVSNSSSSKTSVTKENAFEVDLPSISSKLTYTVTPLMYKTGKNVLKGYHVVGGIAGNQAWSSLYGYAPDPSLNLPKIWQFHDLVHSTDEETWVWTDDPEENPEAREIRGIFFKNSAGQSLGSSLLLGDTVTIKMRVHNFSLLSCAPVDVLFEASTYDPATGTEGERLTIEKVRTSSIPAWGDIDPNWVWISVPWDTSGLEEDNYRIYATVNQGGNVVEELSEKGLDENYDNNQGWYNVFLHTRDSAVTGIKEVSLKAHSINMTSPSSTDSLIIGQKITLSGKVCNEGSGAVRGLSVHFYDGDPADGGKAFASRTIPGIKAGECYPISVNHAFQTSGDHVIHMQVLSKQGEENYSDNVTTTSVSVATPPENGGCWITASKGSFLFMLLLGLPLLMLRQRKN